MRGAGGWQSSSGVPVGGTTSAIVFPPAESRSPIVPIVWAIAAARRSVVSWSWSRTVESRRFILDIK
jgi:hypothetical protein